MQETTPNCVLLADQHHGISEGVRGLLETTFSSVFMVADRPSLFDGAARLSPALVVVDLSLAKGDVPALLQGVRARAPNAKVLLLSVHDERAVTSALVSAGADGVVFTRSIATDLLPAVDSLLAGERYVSPTVVR